MDPISIIVTALVTGAAAGLKPTVEKTVRDAYDSIKSLIHRKYDRVNTDMLEHDPASATKRSILKDDLEKAGAGADEELLRQAKSVLDSVQRYAPDVAGEVGVSLEDIRGASLRIDDIIASGRGVDVRKADIQGDITITKVRAGDRDDPPQPLDSAVDRRPHAAADPMAAINLNDVSAGGNIEIVGTKQYIIMRGVNPYKDFLKDPLQPWDLQLQGTVDVDSLRKRLLQVQGVREPTLITVRGTLYPCALLSPGWWDRQTRGKIAMPDWHDGLQKWLFYGFDLWGPSWDFSWDFGASAQGRSNPYFIAQLGDGDEADSIPVIIPHDKVEKLKEEFRQGWGGLEVTVTGLLGHRRQFSQEQSSIELVGGLLDYCIWLKEDDKSHKISPLVDKTETYSGYLWKCVTPKRWFEQNKALGLNHVYFIWEHTNFAEKDSISYNLDGLAHKERYIASLHGDLILLQKSSSLVPGRPEWSAQEFYDLLMGKKGGDI